MLLVELPLTTLPKIISRDIALNKESQTLKPFSTKAISRQVQNDNALSWEGIRDLNTLETRMLFLGSNATRNIQQANSCSDFGQVFFTKMPFRNRGYFIQLKMRFEYQEMCFEHQKLRSFLVVFLNVTMLRVVGVLLSSSYLKFHSLKLTTFLIKMF